MRDKVLKIRDKVFMGIAVANLFMPVIFIVFVVGISIYCSLHTEDGIKKYNNATQGGTYYVLDKQFARDDKELYISLCSVKGESINYNDRYVMVVSSEPEISNWFSLRVGDTIKYKGEYKFNIISINE